jgi:phage terminase small subunit
MTPAQKAIWRRTIKHAPRGVLFETDATMLRLWCETVDRRGEMQRRIDAARGEFGWEMCAAHRNLDRATLMLIRLATELGFSPAARPRLRVERRPELSPDNPWAMLRLIPGDRSGENLNRSR